VFARAVTAIEDARTERVMAHAADAAHESLGDPELRCVWVAQLRTELRTAAPTKTGCVAGLAPITFRNPANSRSRVRAVTP
jgi:hypothetical protein